MFEFAVDVVAQHRGEASAAQARVVRQIVVAELVGEHEDRRVGRDLLDRGDGGAHEGAVLGGQRELVAGLRREVLDRLGGQPALEHAEARRPEPRLLVARHPQELFALALGFADAAPEARDLGSIADDDATSHSVS